MRQFVHEIGDHLIRNYNEWDLTGKYNARFLKPDDMFMTSLIELDWMPFHFYPSMFILVPSAIKLTIGESSYLYRIMSNMKQVKTLSITKKLNDR